MSRKIGAKDKQKRKSKFNPINVIPKGIRQYPISKGLSPAYVGATLGATLGIWTINRFGY